MKTFFDDVGDFHRKFDLPVRRGTDLCLFPSQSEINYRIDFLEEELQEFKDAIAEGDMPKAIDALVDLTVVALGTAHYFHAPFNEAWVEVHRANMAKCKWTDLPCTCFERTGTNEQIDDCLRHTHKRAGETIRKPPGWQPPNIERILYRTVRHDTDSER